MSVAQASNTDPREVLCTSGRFAQAACASLEANMRALPGQSGTYRQRGRAGTYTAAYRGVPQRWSGRKAAERAGETSTKDRKLGRYFA